MLWLGRGNRWGEKGHPGEVARESWSLRKQLERLRIAEVGVEVHRWVGPGTADVVTGQAWRDLLQRSQMEAGKPLLVFHHSASVNPLVTLQGLLLSLTRADPCRDSGGRAPLLWSCSLLGPPDADISDLRSPELTKVCSSLKTNDPPNSRKSGLMLRSIKDVTRAHLRPCKKKVLRKRKPEITNNPQR